MNFFEYSFKGAENGKKENAGMEHDGGKGDVAVAGGEVFAEKTNV